MKVALAYGQGVITVDLPDHRTTVVEPSHPPPLADEREALIKALNDPIGAPPLKSLIKGSDRICIVFTDITRATPNERLIPWLLEYLKQVSPEKIILLNSLGTHRPNTREELEKMLGGAVLQKYRVLNHEPENPAELLQVGTTRDGTPALLNKHLLSADVRIITGFIEPHFFAGFSGGPKGIMPGVAGLQTVMSNHGAKNISDPKSAFGITVGNPIWEEMRDIALRAGPSFLINVAQDPHRRITAIFAGDLMKAHRVGIEFVRGSAMQRVKTAYEIVVTTNSGYPLDQNLYQGVKGMSAAARIIRPGGTILMAAECREGIPSRSPLDQLLRSVSGPEEILAMLATPGFQRPEQWQAQIQSLIQRQAKILLYSALSDDDVRAAHLTPCRDISKTVEGLLQKYGPLAEVAVLPQGPLTIPYLA